MATLPGERIESTIPERLREQLPLESVAKIRDTVLKARSGEGPELNEEQVNEIRRLIAKGVVKETDVLPPLGVAQAGIETAKTAAGGALETVGGLGSMIASTDPQKDAPNLLGTASNFLQETGKDLKVDRNTLPRTQANLFAGVDLAAAGLIPANIIIKSGKMVAGSLSPVQIRSLGSFKSMLVDASRNPRRFLAIESALGGASGIGGEETVRFGGEDARIVGELLTNFGAVLTARIFKSISNIFKLKAGSRKEAEETIGRFLSTEFDEDIRLEQALDETLEQQVPGARFTLEKGSQSPNLAAATKKLGIRGEEALKMDADTVVAIEDYARKINPKVNTATGRRTPGEISDYQDAVIKETDGMIKRFSLRTEEILNNMSEKIFGSKSQLESNDIGDTFRTMLDREKTSMGNTIGRGYSMLGPLPIRPEDTKGLFKAMAKASFTQAKGTPIPPSVSSVISRLKKSFTTAGFKEVTDETFDVALGRTVKTTRRVRADLAESNLLVLNEIQGDISQAIRTAVKEGDLKEARRLKILQAGTFSVIDSLAKRTDIDVSDVVLLKQVKRMRIEMGRLFENAEVERIFKKDKQGLYTTSPEDLMDVFIRSGKKAFASAKHYNQIFKDSPESRRLLRDSFSYRLRAFATNPDTGQLDIKKIKRFQRKYSDAIKAHGLEDDFADITTAREFAEESIDGIGDSTKRLNRTAFKMFADTGEPENFVDGLIKNPDKLRRFSRGMDRDSSEFAGFRDLVVDRILEGSNKGVKFGESLIGAEQKFDLNFLETVLADPKGILEDVIGSGHIKALQRLAFNIGRSRTVTSSGAKSTDLANEIPNIAVRNILASTRAMLRGFVRADFILFQAAFRTAEALASRKRVDILKLALTDIQFARDLVLMSRSAPLMGSLRSLFSPSTASVLKSTDEQRDQASDNLQANFKGFKGVAKNAALDAGQSITESIADAFQGLGPGQ